MLEFTITSTKFSSWGQFCFWFFVGNFICLGWLGTCPIEDPFILFGRIATFFYFFYVSPFFVFYPKYISSLLLSLGYFLFTYSKYIVTSPSVLLLLYYAKINSVNSFCLSILFGIHLLFFLKNKLVNAYLGFSRGQVVGG